jgi:hypothetical protein
MIRYYYIPIQYKAILISKISEWLNSPAAFVCLTPAKYDKQEVTNNVESGLFLQNGQPILEKKIVPTDFKGNRIGGNLLGFCLEGKLDDATHNLAMSLSGVRCFNSSNEYLEFFNQL